MRHAISGEARKNRLPFGQESIVDGHTEPHSCRSDTHRFQGCHARLVAVQETASLVANFGAGFLVHGQHHIMKQWADRYTA